MHRALDIPDILHAIFQHLQPQSTSQYLERYDTWPIYLIDSQEDEDEMRPSDLSKPAYYDPQALLRRHALASAACAYKAFSDPALDLLWQKLDDITPLLHLLSSVQSVPTVYQDRAGNRGHVYHMRGDICSDEWTRFQYYARRVRYLVDECPRIQVDDSVFIKLSRQTGGNPLLPSLQYLWWQTILLSPTGILLLSSPSLRHLTLVTPIIMPDSIIREQLDVAFEQLLRKVLFQVPLLEGLRVYADHPPTTFLSITEAKHLRRLSIARCDRPISDPTFASALSMMESVTDLTLGLWRKPPSRSSGGFLNLQCLVVHGHLPYIMQLLSTIHSKQLSSIYLADHALEAGLEPLLPCLTFCAEHTSLRTIRLDCGGLDQRNPSSIRRLADIIGKLFPLQNLEYLKIKMRTLRLAWSDEDVLAMASAWPKITFLSIMHGHDDEIAPIYSLRHFARLCPNLVQLGLSRMDVMLAGPPPPDAAQVEPHGLELLQLGNQIGSQSFDSLGTVAEPLQVARFLDRLFPNVCFDTVPPRPMGVGPEWREITLRVVQLQTERGREVQTTTTAGWKLGRGL